MGSDLSMQANDFRPRRTLIFLNGNGLWEVYKDSFYSGYNLILLAADNETSRDIFTGLGYKVVDSRPTAVLGRHEKVS